MRISDWSSDVCSSDLYPTDGRDPSDIDVTERIYALYGLANFESQAGSVPFSGNIGLRWVKTDITSIGYRQPYVITIDTAGDSYSVDPDPNGELLTNRAKGRYNYFLPSANIAFHLSQEVKLPPTPLPHIPRFEKPP